LVTDDPGWLRLRVAWSFQSLISAECSLNAGSWR
jgi:hypothetical protein